MKGQDLRLQRVVIECKLPRSPVFVENAGSIVKEHLSRYSDWRSGNGAFELIGEDGQVRVILDSKSLWARVEPVSKETLSRFSSNVSALAGTASRPSRSLV